MSASSQVVAVSCHGVSKRFPLIRSHDGWRIPFGLTAGLPSFQALADVTFEVSRGSFVGLIGRNGAGKSTLLRVLGGVYSADEGRVDVSGSATALYELGLAGNPDLSGHEYTQRLLTVQGISRAERIVLVEKVREFSELGARFDDPIHTYSAGMTARLFFSAATAVKHDVYLIDEILSVGDQHFQAKCWSRLRERIREGASGILVTHDWSAVAKLCDRACVLEGGKVIFAGPSDKAIRRYLFGETLRQPTATEVARFVDFPTEPLELAQGDTLRIGVGVRIDREEEVSCVSLVEHFQLGEGWEIALMSRSPTYVGSRPGCYRIDVEIPAVPLAPGLYHLGLSLVTPDRDVGGLAVRVLDTRSWINGDALTVRLTGNAAGGLDLPMRWSPARHRIEHAP